MQSENICTKRIFGMDLVRTLATIFIFTYHFNLLWGENGIQIFNETSIGMLCTLGVSMFFVLSGAGLIYGDRGDFSLKQYLKKRFLAVFPLFYVSYLFYFFATLSIGLLQGTGLPNRFGSIPIGYFLLTVCGMDGFFLYKHINFYLVGEWFLGCILCLYIIYPFLRYGVKKYPLITAIIIVFVYGIVTIFYPFEMSISRNPIVRVLEFAVGMYYGEYYLNRERYEQDKSLIVLIVSVTCFIVGLLYVLIGNHDSQVIMQLLGILFFVFLMELAKWLTEQHMRKVVSLFSKYSFAIFLMHHQIIYKLEDMMRDKNLSYLEVCFLFVAYIIGIVFLGVIVYKIASLLKKSINKLGRV